MWSEVGATAGRGTAHRAVALRGTTRGRLGRGASAMLDGSLGRLGELLGELPPTSPSVNDVAPRVNAMVRYLKEREAAGGARKVRSRQPLAPRAAQQQQLTLHVGAHVRQAAVTRARAVSSAQHGARWHVDGRVDHGDWRHVDASRVLLLF